jgi:ATP-dependent exoDNAse (exonuclease V) alpha subunit
MAIFHLSVKMISRSKGRSVVAAAAYRHAARMRDGRTGAIHDYRRKGGVLHSEIAAPEGVPVPTRARLWNAAERHERRRDAQLAREIEIALPAELSFDQQLALTRAWIRSQLVARGMVADFAIHAPGKEGDARNTHVHILLTLRPVTATGFGPKDRPWGNRAMLREWRASWAAVCNDHLERAGSAARIDHRTLKAQGIDRQPGIKKGRAAAIDRKAKRVVSDRGQTLLQIRAANRLRRLSRSLAVRAARALAEEMIDLALPDEEVHIGPLEHQPLIRSRSR